jgi:hypothetical protein
VNIFSLIAIKLFLCVPNMHKICNIFLPRMKKFRMLYESYIELKIFLKCKKSSTRKLKMKENIFWQVSNFINEILLHHFLKYFITKYHGKKCLNYLWKISYIKKKVVKQKEWNLWNQTTIIFMNAPIFNGSKSIAI